MKSKNKFPIRIGFVPKKKNSRGVEHDEEAINPDEEIECDLEKLRDWLQVIVNFSFPFNLHIFALFFGRLLAQ